MNAKQKTWMVWTVAFGILLVMSIALVLRSKMKTSAKTISQKQSALTDFLQVGSMRNKCYDCEERGDIYGYKSKCFDCAQSASPIDTASINYLQDTPGSTPKLGYV